MDKLKKISQELLGHLGIEAEAVKVTKGEADSVNLEIKVGEKEAGILIGYHGETIAALQLILGMILYKQSGKWQKLTVNVGDYREKRNEYLTSLAQDTAAKVMESGEPLALYNLNPYERRLVHLALADRKDVVTESQGEGKQRFLVVSPSTSSGQAHNE